ncbi:Delta-1-pyrroline-5-carboxylate synthase [Balamuthia mandrillaris]
METREDLKYGKRIIVKVGTSVVSTADGFIALGRVGNVVEQLCELQKQDKEVVLVTSGSVGIGKQKLRKQLLLSTSFRTHMNMSNTTFDTSNSPMFHLLDNSRVCAATGQSGLMALYETMFAQHDALCSQILVAPDDFTRVESRKTLRETINKLLSVGVIPIVNENDAISMKNSRKDGWNNDNLAALLAVELQADVLVLLSDVDGLYVSPPPKDPEAPMPDVVSTYIVNKPARFKLGPVSNAGRGGMGAKIEAASGAAKGGVKAVLIASGYKPDTLRRIIAGEDLGTLFTKYEEQKDAIIDQLSKTPPQESSSSRGQAPGMKNQAIAAREASRVLRSLSTEERVEILRAIADALKENEEYILAENRTDCMEAESSGVAEALQARLKLTSAKLRGLAEGVRSIANSDEPIGRLLRKTELAEGLVLEKRTVPIGVLLVIFESRPDALPQVSALALKSGNGLLLKGGKEAKRSNKALHMIITDTIEKVTKGRVNKSVITLVENRHQVKALLALDDVIDLCIPRGSTQLVNYIKRNTRIPVLGHAEGICHVYLDASADLAKAKRIVVDAKTDYPAACNAVETILIHERKFNDPTFSNTIIDALLKNKVQIHYGPKAAELLQERAQNEKSKPAPPHEIKETEDFKKEYGDLQVTIEVVLSHRDAIAHINTYGSGHTDSIVAEDAQIINEFLEKVDSACVFHNASTRFADGQRFGLGGEVGISTSRIHARGPVGVEGLLTQKWQLRDSSPHEAGLAHVAADFTSGKRKFTHKDLLGERDQTAKL